MKNVKIALQKNGQGFDISKKFSIFRDIEMKSLLLWIKKI